MGKQVREAVDVAAPIVKQWLVFGAVSVTAFAVLEAHALASKDKYGTLTHTLRTATGRKSQSRLHKTAGAAAFTGFVGWLWYHVLIED